jgi:ABC-type transport system substrate-binding protein
VLDGKVIGANSFHDLLLKAPGSDWVRVFEKDLEGVRALDDYTLQIKLVKPDPTLLPLLAMNFTSPVPFEAVKKYGDHDGNLLDHPVGTGPFVLKRWDRNREIVLEKNPNFRGEKYPSSGSTDFAQLGMLQDAGKALPFLDRISMQVVKEDQPRWLNFLKGNRDALILPKDNFRQAITDQVNLVPDLVKKGIHLNIETGSVIRYVLFNMKDSLVGGRNKYLRQALSSAIDRDEWINIFTNGTGKKMVNATPPGIQDRPGTEQIKYDYNLARAKELLKKAGYPGGKGLPPIRFDLRGASTSDRQFGEYITEQFQRIGVKTEVITNTFPAFLEKMRQG